MLETTDIFIKGIVSCTKHAQCWPYDFFPICNRKGKGFFAENFIVTDMLI
jgi:hypothetical protein